MAEARNCQYEGLKAILRGRSQMGAQHTQSQCESQRQIDCRALVKQIEEQQDGKLSILEAKRVVARIDDAR